MATHDDRRDPAQQQVLPGGKREWTMTLPEVAAVLKVSVGMVKKLIRQGALRATRISPRVIRVTERALGEFLDERSINGPK
jgi:excisionase family DNA binding protein